MSILMSGEFVEDSELQPAMCVEELNQLLRLRHVSSFLFLHTVAKILIMQVERDGL